MANAPPLVLSPGLLCGRDLWAAQFDTPADVAAMTVGDLTRDGSMAGMAARVLAAAPATAHDRHREIASDVPDLNLVIVRDRGRRSTMERPAVVNAALCAWLAG